MQFLVLGAGMMGSAAASDLARTGKEDKVMLADVDLSVATRAAHGIGPTVHPLCLDVRNSDDLIPPS